MGDGPISDAALVASLRPFVRATRPVLDVLRESDPFRLRSRVAGDGDGGRWARLLDSLATVRAPGTAAWAGMDVEARSRWWVHRVGRVTSLVAAVPGIGGAVANRLPVSKALGAGAQAMLLVAIAGEHGVRSEDDLVALLGAVLFRRRLAVGGPSPAEDAAAAARAAEITTELKGQRPTLRRFGSAVWRLGRGLLALEDELDKRPHGRFYHDAVGLIPVVGAVGKYFGEWSGLKRAARAGEKWLAVQARGTRGTR